jgi:hypothetical protein
VAALWNQNGEHRAEVHFRVSCLETVLHRRLDQVLRLAAAHALTEEIGVAPEVFERCQ